MVIVLNHSRQKSLIYDNQSRDAILINTETESTFGIRKQRRSLNVVSTAIQIILLAIVAIIEEVFF